MFYSGRSGPSPSNTVIGRKPNPSPSGLTLLERSLASSTLFSSTKPEPRSTSTPIDPQLSNSGSSALPDSSDQPMSPSVVSSGLKPSLSSQPVHTVPSLDDPLSANTKPVSMASSESPNSTPAHSNTEIDSGPTNPSPVEPTKTSESKAPTPSTTQPTPQPTSKSPSRSTTGGGNAAPSAATSHVTSIVLVHPSTPSTILTTITSSPESTLSVPSSVFVSINGTSALTAPPMVTVLSTSTQPDGAFVTFTHVVANPVSDNASKQPDGFLQNQGQVAGVFTVVGIVASALVASLVWFIRRHRRRQRRKAWFASLRQYPPSPFSDSYRENHEGNHMRSVQTTSDGMHEPHMVSYHDVGYRPQPSPPGSTEGRTNLGLTGIGTSARGGVFVPLRRPVSVGDPFHDPPYAPQNTPVSFSPNRDGLTEPSGASIAPSSPSIYPESLPPTDDSPSPIDSEPKPQLKAFPEPILRRSLSTPGHGNAPPRPPRSQLRDSIKPGDIMPLTPPSSHGHSKVSNPEIHFTGLPEPFTPRTWLNARPRTAPEAAASQGSRGTPGERR